MTALKEFSVSSLALDLKNYRTGPQPDERAAIAAIIEDQKGKDQKATKLVNLADDILRMGGTSPGEPIWVTREDGKHVVLEGNRRVAALKLLATPALARGTIVGDAFAELAKQFRTNPIRKIDAVVFPSREAAEPWLRRRHLSPASGVGLQEWKPMAKGRADREQGKKAPRFLLVSELLNDGTDEWAGLAGRLDSMWTTVDRALNASAMSSELGIKVDPKTGTITFENGNTEAGKSLLRRILRAMADPDFEFSKVETKDDRTAFLKEFVPHSVKARRGSAAADGRAATTAASKQSTAKAAASSTKSRTERGPRPTLAPTAGTRTFHVDGPRLNPLYRECRKLVVQRNENAAAFLLRVFIELSSEALLVEKKIPLPHIATKKGITKWDQFGVTINTKVAEVLKILDATGASKELKQARVALSDSDAGFSVDTLHAYFHNRQMLPDAAAIKGAWDAWENYLRLLHEAR
jgi:hypothetical protein